MHPGSILRWIYYRSVENVQDKKAHWPRDNMDEAELIKMIPHVVRSSMCFMSALSILQMP